MMISRYLSDEDDEECGTFLYPTLTSCCHQQNTSSETTGSLLLRTNRSRWFEAALCLFLLTVFFSAETAQQARARARTERGNDAVGISSSSSSGPPLLPDSPLEDPKIIFGEDDWLEFQSDYQQRFNNRSPPDSLRPWLRYAKKHQCNERDYYGSIESDLQVFRDIIQQQDDPHQLFRQEEIVPLGIQQTTFYMALQLQNNEWKVVASVDYHHKGEESLRAIQEQLMWLMEPLRAHTPPLNATYFFNLHDGSRNRHSTRPIFSVCKHAYWTDHVSVPTEDQIEELLQQDPTTASSHSPPRPDQHRYPPSNPHVADDGKMDAGIRDILVPFYHNLPRFGHHAQPRPPAPSPTPFRNRRDAIVWRGSTTGPWGTGPRFRLIETFGAVNTRIRIPLQINQKATLTTGSITHRGDSTTAPTTNATNNDSFVNVDFGFTQVVQGKNKELPTGIRMKHYMGYPQMQKHKYIMDVDGNSFTERFPSLLQSGSLVFKSSRYKEWYTERLVPYEDYIPVNYDQSDLVEKVAWAHRHPEWMERMTQQARKTIQEQVRTEDMRCYVYRLMLEYQTLFEAA